LDDVIDGGALSLAGTKEDVPTNREQPPPTVRALNERVPGTIGAQIGLLHDVVGVGFVARE
jgi:hypothetical protein